MILGIKLLSILLLSITQIFDWHSTLAFLKSGKGREGNIFLKKLFEKYGANRVMAVKGLLHGVFIPPILILPPIALVGLIPLAMYYTKIIINNYKIAKAT